MSDQIKNNPAKAAENATGAPEAADHEMTQPAAENAVQGAESGERGRLYAHVQEAVRV